MAEIDAKLITHVIVACEAGMGSSVMLTAQLKKRLGKYGIDVTHSPVNLLPEDAKVVLCHVGLSSRAKQRVPNAVVISFQLFMGDPAFDKVESAIRDGGTLVG
jgi:galactose PTS system EIIB component